MITVLHDYDRSGWFGASDAKYIMAESQLSRSWEEWWKIKCGVNQGSFSGNLFTKAGNTFEHSILKNYVPSVMFDRQILIPHLRLRVNLDGNTEDAIYEVKTYQIDKGFKVTDGYYYQAQIQMLAWKLEPSILFKDCEGCPEVVGKNLPLANHYILAYGLYPDEYYAEYTEEEIEKGLIPIDKDRIKVFPIKPSRGTQRKAKKNLLKLSKRLGKEKT